MTFRFRSVKVATDANPDTISASVDVYIAQDGQDLTLPSRASYLGRPLLIKLGEAHSQGVTITRAGADTIEGNTSYELASDYDFVELVAGTSSWLVTKESTSRVPVLAKTDSHTLVIGDEGALITVDSAVAKTVTIPLNANVAFPVGTQIIVARKGTGTLQIVPTGGVTMRSASGNDYIASQYAGVTLVKVGADEWYLFGDLTSA